MSVLIEEDTMSAVCEVGITACNARANPIVELNNSGFIRFRCSCAEFCDSCDGFNNLEICRSDTAGLVRTVVCNCLDYAAGRYGEGSLVKRAGVCGICTIKGVVDGIAFRSQCYSLCLREDTSCRRNDWPFHSRSILCLLEESNNSALDVVVNGGVATPVLRLVRTYVTTLSDIEQKLILHFEDIVLVRANSHAIIGVCTIKIVLCACNIKLECGISACSVYRHNPLPCSLNRN